MKAGVNGAGVSDVVQAGVVMAGSSGVLLLEAAIISLCSKGVASASEICVVFEPIKLMSALSSNGTNRDSSPYHLPR